MSDQHADPEQPRLSRPALRTRVLMVGVFVGAILAMSVSWVFSWGIETPEEQARAAEEQATIRRQQVFNSPPGSCLTWTASDASDVKKVSCTAKHVFEVAGVADISDKYPRGARQPDAGAWRDLAQERCGESVRKYLDKPLDPFGKLSIGVLRPDAQQWAEGDRRLHCGLQWAAPGGELQPLTKRAAETNQSNVWEPGTCLALVDKSVGDPVSCSAQHSYEIIGVLDLREEFDEFPSLQDQKAWLDRECSKVADRYTGKADLRKEGLILSWDLRERPSWQAGSTLVNCKVGATLKDNSGLAPVRGSVRKEAAPSTTEKESSEGKGGRQQSRPSSAQQSNGG